MTEMAYISGTAAFLPNEPVDNDRIENILGLVNGKPSKIKNIILARNGIKSRHYAIDPKTGIPSHNNAQLTAMAVRRLFESSGLKSQEIEGLYCGTSSPDQLIPGHASMVHGELKTPSCDIGSFAGVCVSSLTALNYGFLKVGARVAENIVVTGSELASLNLRSGNFEPELRARQLDLEANPILGFEADFLRWMLSDGAGAIWVSSSPRGKKHSLRIEWIDINSFAHELPSCMYAGAIKKDNEELVGWRQFPEEIAKKGFFNLKQDSRLLAKQIMVASVDGALGKIVPKYGIRPEEIDWFLPHYSSDFFRQPLYDRMQQFGFNIPYSKWFTNLTEKGNMGAASMFVILDELLNSKRLEKGQKILCFVPESARFTIGYMLLTVV